MPQLKSKKGVVFLEQDNFLVPNSHSFFYIYIYFFVIVVLFNLNYWFDSRKEHFFLKKFVNLFFSNQ